MVPGRGANKLATKRANHERGINAIPARGLDAINRAPLRDLRGLVAKVHQQGLQHGAGDVEDADVGAEAHAEETAAQAEEDGEVRDEAVGHFARPDGADEHAGDADEAEEADGQGRVVVRRAGEEEGQRCPEGGEGRGTEHAGETGLDEQWVSEKHLYDVEEDAEVVHAGVCGGVVGHEEPEEDEDYVLDPQGHPIYGAPGYEVGDCAGEDAGDEHAEHEPAHDDGKGCSSPVGRGEIADKGQHELGGDGCYRGDEGYGCKGPEIVGDAESEPELVLVCVLLCR